MNLYERLKSIGITDARLRALGITPEQPSPAELAERAGVLLAQAKQAKERAEQRISHLAEYRRLREKNPFEASRFAERHPDIHENDDDPPTAA